MKATHKTLYLDKAEDWLGGLFLGTEPQGDSVVLRAGSRTAGRFVTRAIDSGETGFVWGRVSLDCTLPSDSMLRTYACASDTKSLHGVSDLSEWLLGHREGEELAPALETLFGQKPDGVSEDFYLHRTGRYLWLMFEFISTGRLDPALHSVGLRMEGDHMVDYLPAIYRDDDFTRRFVSVFDSFASDMEDAVYEVPSKLDYENTTDDMLAFLASWVCVEGPGSPAELRRWIREALPVNETLYTPAGVRRSVKRLTGKEPILVEHDQVDPNGAACPNPGLYRRLYGEDPFKFFIFLDESSFRTRAEMEDFLERMRGLIPAGTDFELILLKNCVQLDWHTYLGVNSAVGSYVPVMIDENTTIHHETMIGG